VVLWPPPCRAVGLDTAPPPQVGWPVPSHRPTATLGAQADHSALVHVDEYSQSAVEALLEQVLWWAVS